MDPEPRAADVIARGAAGIDEYAGAGAGGGPDLARRVGGADGGDKPAGADDFAHDHGLAEISAGRREQHEIAGFELGLVHPLAKQACSGRPDPAAQRQRRAAAAVELDIVGYREAHAGAGIEVLPVVPGIRPRKVAIGLDEDAGTEQREDDRRHQVAAEETQGAAAVGRIFLFEFACWWRRWFIPGPGGRHGQATVSLLAVVHEYLGGRCRRKGRPVLCREFGWEGSPPAMPDGIAV